LRRLKLALKFKFVLLKSKHLFAVTSRKKKIYLFVDKECTFRSESESKLFKKMN